MEGLASKDGEAPMENVDDGAEGGGFAERDSSA